LARFPKRKKEGRSPFVRFVEMVDSFIPTTSKFRPN
jgi:hypothetical protein